MHPRALQRLSPEPGRPEDAERADSLRDFTWQDKRQVQRARSSTGAEHGVPWRELLRVRNYPSPLDRESDTHSFDHHHDGGDGAKRRHRGREQHIECYSMIKFLDRRQIGRNHTES